MDLSKKLQELKDEQQQLVDKYNLLISESNDPLVFEENYKLKSEIFDKNEKLAKLEIEHKNLLDKNRSLKMTLKEQIIDERLNIIKLSKQKIDLYFKKSKESNKNLLEKVEYDITKEVDKLASSIKKDIQKSKDNLNQKVYELKDLIDQEISKQRLEKLEQEQILSANLNSKYSSISDQELDEETIKKRIKRNKIEMKLGLNWLNKIGIILILAAIVFFAFFNRSSIANEFKGLLCFVSGFIFLAVGEFIYRKKMVIFSTGVIGGGVGILYSAIFFSYFLLQIISMNLALLISLLVTFAVIVLSLRYNSKTILSLSLVGGFLPFLAFLIEEGGFSGNLIYYAMSYLFILNLVVLITSFKKKWILPAAVSFFMHIPALVYLVFDSDNLTISLIYVLLSFASYLISIISYALIHKVNIKAFSIVLLALNTFISALILYVLLGEMGLKDFRGILSLILCGVYAFISWLFNQNASEEKKTKLLFLITALTFAVLMIPFQFGIAWISMGWLVEGLLLIFVGNYKNKRIYERIGWIIFILCIVSFVGYDIESRYDSMTNFIIKFSSLISGFILSLFFYQRKNYLKTVPLSSPKSDLIKLLKYTTIVSTYIYAIYMLCFFAFGKITPTYNAQIETVKDFYRIIIFITITFSFAIVLKNFKALFDNVLKVASVVLFVIGDLFSLTLLLTIPILRNSDFQNVAKWISFIVLIIYNLYLIYNVRYLLLLAFKRVKANFELYPIFFGLFLLGWLTIFITVQARIGNVSLIISFAYIFLSIGFIIYGFLKKYTFIRYMGIALIFITLVKTLIFDIFLNSSSVSYGGKILAFFGFGILCIAISFGYQLINKKIEESSEIDSISKEISEGKS